MKQAQVRINLKLRCISVRAGSAPIRPKAQILVLRRDGHCRDIRRNRNCFSVRVRQAGGRWSSGVEDCSRIASHVSGAHMLGNWRNPAARETCSQRENERGFTWFHLSAVQSAGEGGDISTTSGIDCFRHVTAHSVARGNIAGADLTSEY